jgi:hypothetical protein
MSMDTPLEDISSSSARLCKNPNCKKPLTRRSGEAQSAFDRRLHCEMACSKTNPLLRQSQKEEFARQREAETKNCVICTALFHRGTNESRANYKNRATCSRLCANKKLSKNFEEEVLKYPKICANPECGKTFYRRLRGETRVRFERRRACCVQCEAKYRQVNSKHPWQKKTRKTTENSLVEDHKLPDVSPTPTPIPDPPKPTVVKVWRPESWGGEFYREVS